MIREYNLETEGVQFKADFNSGFELIEHLLEVRTMEGYWRIDLVTNIANQLLLCYREVSFKENYASLRTELVE